MRHRHRTLLPPTEPPWKKTARRFLIGSGLLGMLYLYVFVLSPASCSSVQKKIDQTVEQNTRAETGGSRAASDEEKTPGRAALNLQVPAEITGETQEDLMVRDQLAARMVSGRVQKKEKFTQSLVRNGVDMAEARRLISAFESKNVFNFARAQPGQLFTIQMSDDGTRVFTFEYHFSSRMKLQAQRTAKGFTVQKITAPVMSAPWAVGVRIQTNLKAALEAVGENAQLAALVEALFRDEIEPREFEKGDTVRILVEKRTLHKKFFAYGPVLAVQLVSRRKGSFSAYRGPNGGYYTADGLSFFRRFLPRPLPGNAPPEPDPQTGGVVFPAHRNPPVWTLAPGKVVEAGWAGQLGRRVEIVHENEVRSVFYQLGSIATGLKAGDTVTRRQIIGSAGFSGTTPDRNGAGVLVTQAGRPVSIYALSTTRQDPLPADLVPAFSRQVETHGALLSALQFDAMGLAKSTANATVKKEEKTEKAPAAGKPASRKRKPPVRP
ncbi:MAG: hypothetical protein CVU65_03655 [Deltaproteobacteria bacterium HGW-Deltaproteobacteria-22]|nr:MAG: hypothetical protein CVU65_03655 [Deltaproteobacteria bacterium HGW-Deltaproteobacteria-22]